MPRGQAKQTAHLSKRVADSDTVDRAERDLKRGKSASTAAGGFVREEIDHIREGKHGARSAKQAIAIGLSKARRAGVPLATPKRGQTSERTRKQAKRELAQGPKTTRVSSTRSKATTRALQREGTAAVSKRALSGQARRAAAKRKKASGTSTPSKQRTRR